MTFQRKEQSSVELILTTPINNPGARLRVRSHVSMGTDPKSRPGVGFDLMFEREPVCLKVDDEFRLPFGVVDRDQIRALRNLLTNFLLDYPDSIYITNTRTAGFF